MLGTERGLRAIPIPVARRGLERDFGFWGHGLLGADAGRGLGAREIERLLIGGDRARIKVLESAVLSAELEVIRRRGRPAR